MPNRVSLNHQASGRTAEHVAFMMLVAGSNKVDKGIEWVGWIADAAAALLQGQQPQQQRSQLLCMRAPSDGLIAQTPHWKAKLCLMKSNIYGLTNAPRLWNIEAASAWPRAALLRQDGLQEAELPEPAREFDHRLRGRLLRGLLQGLRRRRGARRLRLESAELFLAQQTLHV